MNRIDLRIDGEDYWVEGGDFDDMLDSVRGVPGRRFDPRDKVWILPIEPRQAAAALRPFKLMQRDDDALAESAPIQVPPA